MIQRVMFVSRTANENLVGDWKDFALISIAAPNAVGSRKIDDKKFARVSFYHFHDAVPERENDESVFAMDEKHAQGWWSLSIMYPMTSQGYS